MGPHRRKLVLKALFEIRGALVGISAEKLLRANDDELSVLLASIEKALDGAQTTDPLPPPA